MADVIIYDYLTNADILAFARPDTECIFVGKHGGGSIMPQEEINRLMTKKASEENHRKAERWGPVYLRKRRRG